MDEQYAWLYQDMEERTEAVEKLLDQPHALSGEIHRRKMKIEVLRRAVSAVKEQGIVVTGQREKATCAAFTAALTAQLNA